MTRLTGREGSLKMSNSTAVAKQDENVNLAVNPDTGEIDAAGLSGWGADSIPIPLVKLVTRRTEQADLANGETAPINKYYNAGTMSSYEEFKIRPIVVHNGQREDRKGNMKDAIGLVARVESTGEIIFMNLMGSYAYWEFRNKAFPILLKNIRAGKNIFDVVLEGGVSSADNKEYGKIDYPTFTLDTVEEAPEAVRQEILAQQDKYKAFAAAQGNSDDDGETIEEHEVRKRPENKKAKVIDNSTSADDAANPPA